MKRIKSYHQLEYSDCGQTCIRIISDFYGLKLSSCDVNKYVDAGRIGMNATDISLALNRIGFETAVVKLGTEKIKEMPLPATLYWNQNHFVVLYKIDIKRGKYYIVDPAIGKRKIKTAEFIESFNPGNSKGIAILIDPTNRIKEFDNKLFNKEDKKLYKFINSTIISNKRTFSLAILLALIAIITDISLPFLFQHTIDEGINSKNVTLIWMLVLSQLAIFIGNYISNSLADVILSRLGLSMSVKMLNDYLRKLVNLPLSFFKKKFGADLIQKMEDHTRIKDFVLSFPEALFFSCISLVIFSSILIYYDLSIFLIFLLFSVIGILWSSLFLRYRREIDCSLATNVSENRNNIYELIDGIEEVKANNAHKQRVSVWRKIQDKINELSYKSTLLRTYQNGGNMLFLRLRDIIVTGICATYVVNGEMTFGIMMTLSYIVGRLSNPFNVLAQSINIIQDARLSYERIDEIVSAKIDCSERYLNYGTIENIKINNLWFKYPGSGSPFVLSEVNCSIPKNQITAIVGKTGCGKSTLVKLLLGLYYPTKGNVMWGENNLLNYTEDFISNNVAVVLQNGTIFSTNIISNIAFADENPDIERVKAAAREACIDEFINSLPMSYWTKIGKSGIELSGGQIQRLLIARAIYRDTEILILDEATSSLDATTEARIMQNLFNRYKNRTMIISAHRLSTIKNADSILVLNNGTLVESGTHSDLIAKGEHYYNLVNNQI